MAKIHDLVTGDFIADHGMRFTKEYRTWLNIKTRSFNKKDATYQRYGAKGIVMCDEWKDSFISFYNHVGPCPSPKHSIDRIKNSLGYAPGNCRWATNKEQQNNKTNNRIFVINGVPKGMTQLCEEYKIDKSTFQNRLKRGWSVDRSLNERIQIEKSTKCPHLNGLDPLTFGGETKPLRDFCMEHKIRRGVFVSRIKSGWSVEAALKVPASRKKAQYKNLVKSDLA